MGMLFTRFYGIIKTLLSKSSRFSKNVCFQKELLRSQGVKVLNANLSPMEHFKLMSIVDAIPHEWRQIIRQSTQHLPPHIDDTIYLRLDNSEEALSKVSSKWLYNAFKRKKQVPPTAQKKFKEKFPQFPFDWKKIYSLSFTVTIETKIREFQYKVLI